MKLNLKKIGGVLVACAPMSAFAVGPDLTPLTNAIDVSTVVTAVLAVAVIGIGFILAKKGATAVMGFISHALGR